MHSSEILDLITNLPPLRHGVKFRSFINSQLSGCSGKRNLRFASVCPSFVGTNRLWTESKTFISRNETKRKEKRFPFSANTLSPLLFPPFVSSSIRQIIVPPPVAQYNDIPRRNTSTRIHLSTSASDEIVSRSGLQIYYNKDAIFHSVLLAIPRTRPDFPFSAQRDSTLCVRVICALHTRRGYAVCTRGIRGKYNSVDTLACSLGNGRVSILVFSIPRFHGFIQARVSLAFVYPSF